MDLCPFCGKAFKRLKSHLPHCKLADTKNATPKTDHGVKSVTASLVPKKVKGTTLPVMEQPDTKIQGKTKSVGPKNQVRQEKTASLPPIMKARKASSGTATTKEGPTIMTTHIITSPKERVKDQIALPVLNVPIQQAVILRSGLERTVSVTKESPALQTVRDQVSTETIGDWLGLSRPEQVEDHFPGQFNEQVYLRQSSLPMSPPGSTKPSMLNSRSTSLTQERARTRISGNPTDVGNEETRSTEKSTELKMDVVSPPKTLQIAEGPLGLQWLPPLYSSYVQLCIVPGRQDQWHPPGRGTEASLHELSRSGRTESVVENQSTPKRLLDIRLGELPGWLASQRYSPKRIPGGIENAWGRYYNKYINVKKGGVGGLAMLLVGYCVLSYSWNYHHISKICPYK
ncbi:hypothetical protein GDO81_012583 [Engystomops pustulosus]|uniref:ATP synthase membrane subunit f n=1 Tax=Engystomops pustulosus TaxID=76066 RepID=A0AAV7B123_ENGPU|nr:hypothetical protein GDO81_012583 [Engystomops pustulosus]KAG8564819.1 hypothetical protein GDO81_012583 [Engystomops pustulosus]